MTQTANTTDAQPHNKKNTQTHSNASVTSNRDITQKTGQQIHINSDLVAHVASLAHLPFDVKKQSAHLISAFEETLAVIDNLKEVDTNDTDPTHQVTGLENVLREDTVDERQMFSQKETLQNAAQQYQGFFVVPQVLDRK